MSAPDITIDGLSISSATDLCRSLKAIGARADRESTVTRKYGDAALVNVITTIAPGVLAIILAFIVRGASGKKSESSYKFRRLESDGSVTECEMRISAEEKESKELSASSLKQLASIVGVTVEEVKAAVDRLR